MSSINTQKEKKIKADEINDKIKTNMTKPDEEYLNRLNVASKSNYKHVYMFTDEEQELFTEYVNTITYEDVVELSIKLFNRQFKGMEEQMQKMKQENEQYKKDLEKDSDDEIQKKLEDLLESLNKPETDQSDNSCDCDGDQDGGDSGDGGKDGEGKEGGEGKDGDGQDGKDGGENGKDAEDGEGKKGKGGKGKESEKEDGNADSSDGKKDDDKKDDEDKEPEDKKDDKKSECPEETKKQIKKLPGRADTMMKAESLLKEAAKRGIDIKKIIKKMIEKGLIVFSSEIGQDDCSNPSRDFGECRWIMKALEELKKEMDQIRLQKANPRSIPISKMTAKRW